MKKTFYYSTITLLLFILIIGCSKQGTEENDKIQVPDGATLNSGAQFENGGKVTFIVYGDSRDNLDIHRTIVSNILLHNPNFILHVGDMVNNGNSMDQWNEHLKITQPIHNTLYPTPGNWEKPFTYYFEIYSKLYGGSKYYSFDWGNMHFVSLNTNIETSPGSEQYNWLIKDLEENKNARWKFVFGHHPIYSSGSISIDDKLRDNIVSILEKYEVDMVFAAHDHIYQRSYPILYDKVDENGIVYIVSGGGGAKLSPKLNNNWWTAKSEKTHHFVKIEIENGSLSYYAYDLNNKQIDKYNIEK